MPFLKFSRDKRGYEHFYLVQPTNRRGRARSPVLYWFRSPPNVKVGREPFDEAGRRALEAQNPDVSFDWPTLLDTPIPPPPPVDVERWRERRRAERAVRQELDAGAADNDVQESAMRDDRDRQAPIEDRAASPAAVVALVETVRAVEGPAPVAAAPGASDASTVRRRRRRRRGRGGPRLPGPAGATAPEPSMAEPREGPHEGKADEPSDV